MAIPIQIDEKRVIALHNTGLSVYVISQRFGCGVARIKGVLVRNGFTQKVPSTQLIGTLGCGAVRRLGHRPGLGD